MLVVAPGARLYCAPTHYTERTGVARDADVGSFADDTRVHRLDHGRYEAVLDPDWGIWGPNGGYLGAVALRAVGQHCSIDTPVSYSCHYANVAEFGKVQLRLEDTKRGRVAESVDLTISQRDERSAATKTILRAMVWVARETQTGFAHDPPPTAVVDGPEEHPPMSLDDLGDAQVRTRLWQTIEFRPVELHGDRTQMGVPRLQGWFRFRPDACFEDSFLDAARSLLLVDNLIWPAARLAHPGVTGVFAPSMDLHVHFHRKASDEPDGSPWLFADAHAETAQRGLLSGSVSVWARSGRLLASGRSLSVLRRAG
jgi:acyl-CoA thioesterase